MDDLQFKKIQMFQMESEIMRLSEERDRLEREGSEMQASCEASEEDKRRVQADVEATLERVIKLETEHSELNNTFHDYTFAFNPY